MADSTGFEQNSFGVLNTADGITFKFITTVIENTFFAVNYAIQSKLNEAKLYRKNYVTTFFSCLLDYLHVIPFLIYSKSLFSNMTITFLIYFL